MLRKFEDFFRWFSWKKLFKKCLEMLAPPGLAGDWALRGWRASKATTTLAGPVECTAVWIWFFHEKKNEILNLGLILKIQNFFKDLAKYVRYPWRIYLSASTWKISIFSYLKASLTKYQTSLSQHVIWAFKGNQSTKIIKKKKKYKWQHLFSTLWKFNRFLFYWVLSH